MPCWGFLEANCCITVGFISLLEQPKWMLFWTMRKTVTFHNPVEREGIVWNQWFSIIWASNISSDFRSESLCVSVQMHLCATQIGLHSRENYFSEGHVAHLWLKCMLTSLAHVRPSGGLMVKNSNISKEQWHFLKGHIEAIAAMFDHSNYFKFFVILVKFIGSINYNAFCNDFDCTKRSLLQTLYSELSHSSRFLNFRFRSSFVHVKIILVLCFWILQNLTTSYIYIYIYIFIARGSAKYCSSSNLKTLKYRVKLRQIFKFQIVKQFHVHRTLQYSALRFNTIQYSTVQYTIQMNLVIIRKSWFSNGFINIYTPNHGSDPFLERNPKRVPEPPQRFNKKLSIRRFMNNLCAKIAKSWNSLSSHSLKIKPILQ